MLEPNALEFDVCQSRNGTPLDRENDPLKPDAHTHTHFDRGQCGLLNYTVATEHSGHTNTSADITISIKFAGMTRTVVFGEI